MPAGTSRRGNFYGVLTCHPPPTDVRVACLAGTQRIMAVYKQLDFLTRSTHLAFDAITPSGKVTPYSGIFRCVACGREIAAPGGSVLPGDEHHAHADLHAPVEWLLIVAAN